MQANSPFKWWHFESRVILQCVHARRLAFKASCRKRQTAFRLKPALVFTLRHQLPKFVGDDAVTRLKRFTHHLVSLGSTLRARDRQVLPSASSNDERFVARRQNVCESERAVEIPVPCWASQAVDKAGNRLDFLLTAKRYAAAAKRFLAKALGAEHTVVPRVINVDKSTAYPPALDALHKDGTLPAEVELRQRKFLNNRVEVPIYEAL